MNHRSESDDVVDSPPENVNSRGNSIASFGFGWLRQALFEGMAFYLFVRFFVSFHKSIFYTCSFPLLLQKLLFFFQLEKKYQGRQINTN